MSEEGVEPPLAVLLRRKRGKTKSAKKPSQIAPDPVPVDAEPIQIEPESSRNGPSTVSVSMFDDSVENHFRVMHTISELCGEAEEDEPILETELQRLQSSTTFLREWADFKYEPRDVRFACEAAGPDEEDVISGINLRQFSSATVPQNVAGGHILSRVEPRLFDVVMWKFSASNASQDTRPLLCFSADTNPIRALSWAPVESNSDSANVIATAGHGGLKFWDLRDPFRPLWDIDHIPRFIYSLDWLPDPRCLLLSFDDGTMRLLSLTKVASDAPTTGKPFTGTKQQGLHNLGCLPFAIWSVQVSRLTGMVAYCGADGTVLRFQLTSKAVEKDAIRNRAPHFLCVSLTEEDSVVTINTPVPNNPFPLKTSRKAEPNKVKREHDKMATASEDKVLALCYGDDPGVELESGKEAPSLRSKPRTSGDDQALVCMDQEPFNTLEEEIGEKGTSLKSIVKQKSKSSKNTEDEQELVCRDEELNNLQRENIGTEYEVFPSKLIAMHRVRWNMNKGSERWLCYGGAAGLVRCQEIALSEIDTKWARKK